MDSASSDVHQPLPLIPFFFETNPPSPLATTNSLFFRLPREIRDEIYDYVWAGSRHYPREAHRVYDFFYGAYGDHWRRRKLPRGVLACKLLLAEALEQYYCEVQCLGYSDYREECAPSPYRLLTLHRVRKVAVEEYMNRSKAIIRMMRCNRLEMNSPRAQFRPRWTVYKQRHLIPFIGSRKHAVRDLSATFELRDPLALYGLEDVTEWNVDLSSGFMELGTGFDRVQFKLRPANTDKVFTLHEVGSWVIVYRMIQFALESLARYLVGGGACRVQQLPLATSAVAEACWGIEVRRTRVGEVAESRVTPSGTIGSLNHSIGEYVTIDDRGVVLRYDLARNPYGSEEVTMVSVPTDEDLAKSSKGEPGTCHYVSDTAMEFPVNSNDS